MSSRFQPGDHLQVRRRGLYHHHGIYISDDRVIQFGSGITLLDKSRALSAQSRWKSSSEAAQFTACGTVMRADLAPAITRQPTSPGRLSASASIGARATRPAGGSAGRLQRTLYCSGGWRAVREPIGRSRAGGHSRSPAGLSSAPQRSEHTTTRSSGSGRRSVAVGATTSVRWATTRATV
jgi:hypothetical protein